MNNFLPGKVKVFIKGVPHILFVLLGVLFTAHGAIVQARGIQILSQRRSKKSTQKI
jgi:predicted metallopeptidase